MNALVRALHERALDVAARYRKVEADLLEILDRIDEKKVFRVLGYSSLFQYALAELKLSEAVAYQFISVARKAREIPEIKSEIKSGNLTVAKANRIVSVIQKDNAPLWLEKAKTLPKAQLEKEVAKTNPAVLTPERATFVSEKRIALQLGVSEEVYEQLKRVKDILSQKKKGPATLEDAIAAMADLYIERNDPVEKAKRAAKKSPRICPGRENAKTIPASSRHEVVLRDHGQCSETLPTGQRCGQKRWLDVHHIRKRKDGGDHSINNLQLLCFSHHRAVHLNE